MTISVLYCGGFAGISTSRMRAEALERIGLRLARLDTAAVMPGRRFSGALARLTGYASQRRETSRNFVAAARSVRPDIVWCDKTIFLTSAAIAAAREQTRAVFVHYNPDDPFGSAKGIWRTFIAAIPNYDVHFVPKPRNVAEYVARGARSALHFDRGFCPVAHVPPPRHHARWAEFAVPIAFTGSREDEREASLAHLVTSGIPVAIRGSLWPKGRQWNTLRPGYLGPEVDGEDYQLALGAPQITLHFLRHANRDEQDSRTFEIPACGGFMMAEWSPRHAELFEEDLEAVFFRSDAELLEKVRYYLARPQECAVIAARGRARALSSGYDYESRMRELLGKACRAAGRDDLLARLALAPRGGAATAANPSSTLLAQPS